MSVEANLRELAPLLITEGGHQQAKERLFELLQQQPDNRSVLLMLGGLYFTTEQYKEAEIIFARLTRIYPGVGKFSIALFNTLRETGRIDEAMEEIRRFLLIADRDKEQKTLDQYQEIVDTLYRDLNVKNC